MMRERRKLRETTISDVIYQIEKNRVEYSKNLD